jgi:arylsulfatase
MNVLVISFDALRADALGVYGYPRETSPNLNAFAHEALVFDNAYVASPVTPTSFAAAFTGLYPYKAFVGWKLISSTTLATVMQEAGYRTFALMNNVQLVTERNFDQGFDQYDTGPWADEKLLEDAIETIDQAASGQEPFFGWIHFISPHTPYEFREMSAHLAGPKSEGRFADRTGGNFEIEHPDEIKRVRDLYDGEIFFADHNFGRLISHLQETGILDRTIVIVTSDHGEEFLEHGQVQHNALYEELVRVPLLVRHPGNPNHLRSGAPVMTMDLLPTVTSMVGLNAPPELDGIDLRQPVDPNRHRIVVGMTNRNRHEILSEQNGQKLIQSCKPEFSEELYNVHVDPGESSNIILDHPGVANRLGDLLENATGTEPCLLISNASQGVAPEELLSKEQIEELKSLGYIQ